MREATVAAGAGVAVSAVTATAVMAVPVKAVTMDAATTAAAQAVWQERVAVSVREAGSAAE